MLHVGIVALVFASCSSGVAFLARKLHETGKSLVSSMPLMYCGTSLVVMALMMWDYMMASSPECGRALWVLGCIVLGTVVLGFCGLCLLFQAWQALGKRAPAPTALHEVHAIEVLEESSRRSSSAFASREASLQSRKRTET